MEFGDIKDIANELVNEQKKVNLLYAFNGTGKTRLSMAFKDFVNGEENDKVLYFNAFIEDLFHWNNNYDEDNSNLLQLDISSIFFQILKESGKDSEVISLFQYYSGSQIEPNINFDNGEIVFILPTGDDDSISNIKISRGEESVFIWSIFYVLMEEIIEKYNSDKDSEVTKLDTNIEYIFIDDPVSSLDDNHLMNLTLDLSKLIKNSKNKNLKFIITTHHPLFYNILHNEFSKANKYLYKKEAEKFILEKQKSDSPFSYHLEIKRIIEEAISNNSIHKYHFTLLRNLLEKTATFLGYKKWQDCILEENKAAYQRIINLHSHNSHSMEEYKEPTEPEKAMLKKVFEDFLKNYKWNQE